MNLKAYERYLAPSIEKLSPKLSESYKEATRHGYRDEKRDLLFYILRLVDKNNPQKKIVFPLSYEHWKRREEAL